MADPIKEGTKRLPIRIVLMDDGEVHSPASATYREMTIVRPDNTKLTVSGDDVTVGVTSERDGSRPCLEHILEEATVQGYYYVEGFIRDAAGEWPAETLKFYVRESIRAG